MLCRKKHLNWLRTHFASLDLLFPDYKTNGFGGLKFFTTSVAFEFSIEDNYAKQNY